MSIMTAPFSIDPEDTGDLAIDVGRRLARVRRAMGVDQKEFGRRAGLSPVRYSQYERGARRLTIEAALTLCHVYALTLDYLYRGDPSGLPYKMAVAIRDLSRNSE